MKERKAKKKAQSAMEYLMTYGWAILIIAVVLVVLFKIGVFSGSAFVSTACIASSGFQCSSPVYYGGTAVAPAAQPSGNVMLILGQSTGSTYYNVAIAYAQAGAGTTASGGPNVAFAAYSANTADPAISSNTLNSGQQSTIMLNASAITAIGGTSSGALWVAYTTNAPPSGVVDQCIGVPGAATPTNAGCLYEQIATMTLKAT